MIRGSGLLYYGGTWNRPTIVLDPLLRFVRLVFEVVEARQRDGGTEGAMNRTE